MVHDRPLTDDEYDLDDDGPRYEPDPDPISEGVGHPGFYQHYTLEDCQESFKDSPIARHPETFDRYYPMAEPRVLVDILGDGSPEQLRQERDRKRCEFKERWCAKHDYRYLALGESDCTVEQVRELLSGGTPEAKQQAPKRKPATPRAQRTATPARQRRGKLQRPKATA